MEKMNGLEIREKAIAERVWGIASSIDVYNCHPDKIRCAETISRFVRELCELLEMKRFGDTTVVHFGEDEKVAGYSMVQLIETSLVSGHFANLTNTAYIDVFSCKPYDPDIIKNFTEKFFEGSHSAMHVQFRK
jgi:S-adenosylmethionine/arginine decarboxylase-like enzyme